MKELTEIPACEENKGALLEDAAEELNFEFFIDLNS
jgi:hypothetical protein